MQVTLRIGAGASYERVKDLFVKCSYNFLRVYNLLVQLLLPMSPQVGRLWRSHLLMYTVDFIYKRKKKFWLNPLAKLALISFYPPILHLRIEPFFFFPVSKSVLFIWFLKAESLAQKQHGNINELKTDFSELSSVFHTFPKRHVK